LYDSVGIIPRKDRDTSLRKTKEICDYLLKKNIGVRVEKEVSELLGYPHLGSDLHKEALDLAVTVGGDGTILRAASILKKPETPLLTVNMGMRGFLTEVGPEEALDAIERVLSGDYMLESCSKISSWTRNGDKFQDSLNEVLIASSLPSKMLRLELYVDGTEVFDFQSDGIIVATPTGSTAYSLSAGGSILATSVEAMIVTAVCPLSPFKSMVVPQESTIEVKLTKPETSALVVVDGIVQKTLRPEDTVIAKKSDHKAVFVRFQPFYSRLKNRLLFSYKGNGTE